VRRCSGVEATEPTRTTMDDLAAEIQAEIDEATDQMLDIIGR
jgi:hypothetical protein